MDIQNSYENSGQGQLYVVPTPIGNLDDMTFRAVDVLKSVNLIAAEDTRHTRKLLNHFSITNDLLSYHEHNHKERISILLEKLARGEKIALVSDAGMPAISDPGYELVRAALEHKNDVVVLPGANAAITALVGSGLTTHEFKFIGFLPRKNKDKKEKLRELATESATMIFYESPHRVLQTLETLYEQFGQRTIAIARELTKVYEQFIRGSIDEIIDWVGKNPLRGECVIVVGGTDGLNLTNPTSWWWEKLTIPEHVKHYEKANKTHKEAMKLVAKDRNISRRDVYRAIHVKD